MKKRELPENFISKLGKNLILFVLFGAIVFIALSIYANFGGIIDAFSSFRIIYIPLIFSLIISAMIMRFVKWNFFLRMIEEKIGVLDSFIIFISGLSMSLTPAKMGEVFKSYLLKKLKRTKMRNSTPVIIAERVTDIIALLILAAFGASVFSLGIWIIVIVSLMAMMFLLLIQSKSASYFLIRNICKIRFFSDKESKIREIYESSRGIFSIRSLAIAVPISIVAWLLECMAFFFILVALGVSVDPLVPVFVFSFSTIAGAVSMIPGGIGLTEFGMAGLLGIYGVGKEEAAGATVLIRLFTLWFWVIVGSAFVYIFRKRFDSNAKN